MRHLLTLVVLALAAAACGSTSGEDSDAAVAVSDEACPPSLANPLGSWGELGFRGSIVLVEQGEPTCRLGVGAADDEGTPITADTVFSIGSVTKSVTAAAVLTLVDDGLLGLDTPIVDVLPELSTTATVRDVLVHEAGFGSHHGSDLEDLELEEALARIADIDELYAPGTDGAYSNTGYTVVAAMVERLTGQSFRDAVVERTLTSSDGELLGGWWHGLPAAPGPRAIGYTSEGATGTGDPDAGPRWGLEGAGGVAMSSVQLATWALDLPDQLSAEAFAGVSTTRDGGDGETFGWVAAGPPVVPEPGLFSAGGGATGHNVVIGWWPDSRRVLVISSTGQSFTAEALFERIVAAVVEGGPIPAAEVGRPDPNIVDGLVGDYDVEGGSLVIEVDEDLGPVARASGAALGLLLPLPVRDGAEEVASEHAEAVLELADEEADALADAFGTVESVSVTATVVVQNELRTWVEVRTGDGVIEGWYALDAEGQLAAAELPAAPVTLRLAAHADGAAVVGSDGRPKGAVLVPTDDGFRVGETSVRR